MIAAGQCPHCNAANSYANHLCEACRARLPWAEALEAAAGDLTAERQRWQNLLQTVPGVVWEAWGEPDSAEQRINFVSDYVEELLGYTVEEWVSVPNFWLNIVHPDDRAAAAARARETFVSGEPGINQFRWMTRDGRAIWANTQSMSIRDADGKPVGMRGVTIDASERRTFEELLRLSERRHRLMADAVPHLTWSNNAEGRAEHVNLRLCEYTGRAESELLGLRWLSAIHPDDVGAFIESRTRGIQAGQAYEGEIRMLRHDGAYRWHLARVVPLKDDDGTLHNWMGAAADINDIKQSEAVQRFFAEASQLLTATLDLEATLATIARLALIDFADYCIIDLTDENGLRQAAVAHSDSAREASLRALAQCGELTAGAAARVHESGRPEFRTKLKADQLEYFAGSARSATIFGKVGVESYLIHPLRARGRVLGTLTVVSVDATRRYSDADLAFAGELADRASLSVDNAILFRQAEAAREQAEAANRAKDEFLATVSHELRTPLGVILGWSNMLGTGQLDADAARDAAAAIERNARVQGQIINDLLDVSRMITGKLPLEVQPTSLEPVIAAALEAVQPAASARGVVLRSIIDEPGIAILGDATRLQQVLWNLLSNAVRFTPPAGAVTVQLAREESDAVLTVTDTGQGIDAEFLPYVFDRFRQADSSSTRRHSGLGLGLAIVRHLVEMHGGIVHAASAGAGHGAAFTARLPLLHGASATRPVSTEDGVSATVSASDAETANIRKSSNRHQAETGVVLGKNLLIGFRILVVDDEDDSRLLVQHLLERHSADVRAAASVSAARTVLNDWRPHLVVSDLAMPGEDGYSLQRWLQGRQTEAPIPAIALTAYARAEDRDRVLAAGFAAHVAKPVEPHALTAAIASALEIDIAGIGT